MRRPDIVNQISQAIQRVAPTATAILYGSEARGDARSDSDIDVLILLDGDKLTLKQEMEVTGPLNEIEWQTGILVSPTVMLRKQWENMPFKTPFYINVMNEGIRIWRKRLLLCRTSLAPEASYCRHDTRWREIHAGPAFHFQRNHIC